MTTHRPGRLRLLVAALASVLLLTGATMASAASIQSAQLGKGSGAAKPMIVLGHGASQTPAAGSTSPGAGRPIDRRDAYRMVTKIATVAGIPRHISPHSLRHAAITNALDAGVPLRDADPRPPRRPANHRAP